MKNGFGEEIFEWCNFLEALNCKDEEEAREQFDVDAILDYATYIDYGNGNRYWKKDVDTDDYWQFVQDHAK
jgi:hypothetical protein